MPEDETLSKAELALIDRIVGALGIRSLQKLLWDKVEQAFRFTFRNTQVNYGFTHATPDPLALKYLKERTFILSDKTQDRLTGNLRWELLEGIRNTESIDEIKKRLDKIFEGSEVNTERIARTETLNAMNAGRLEAYEASEVTHYKMWRAAINNKRTAEDSKRLHGQIQELGNPFVDPKTGDAVMHPPNRPNCRCAMIPLRKLPENVVRKGGQMYVAEEMVGKIEIDVGSLNKTEKRIWIKPTSKRKGHYRKVKGAKKVKEVKKPEVSNMEKLDIISRMCSFVDKKQIIEYKNKIDGLSKADLNIEFLKMQEESPDYHNRYLEGWTRRDRDRIDGYVTQKLGLDEKNSRLYDKESDEPFPTYEIGGPFKDDDILMKSILLNQERLRIDHPEGSIPLYRGLGPDDYDKKEGQNVGDKTDIRMYNMSSWTEYPEIADMYASLGGKGIVVKVDIPIENILWSTRLEGGTAGRGDFKDTDGFEYIVLHGGYQETQIANKKVYDKRADFDTLYDFMEVKREEEINAGKI